MTVRQIIQQRTLLANLCIWIGFILAFMSILYQKSTKGDEVSIATVVGFSLFLVGIIYGYYHATRCPSCRGSLYYLLLKHRAVIWLSVDIQNCPYCSLKLEEEWTVQGVSPPDVPDKSSYDQLLTDANQEVSLLEDQGSPKLTGRKLIENQRRLPLRRYWIGIGVFILGGFFLMFSTVAGGLLIFVGFSVYLYAHFHLQNCCNCPWCHHRLENLEVEFYNFTLPSKIKVCPYCARKFDDELKDRTAQTKALTKYPE